MKEFEWNALKIIVAALLAIALLALFLICLTGIFEPLMDDTAIGGFGIPAQMVLAMILGSATLLATFAFVAVVFSALKMENKQQALGLPEGSVRAIIAFSLIIIFVIMSVYLFNSIEPRTLKIENASYFDGSAFIYANGTAYIPKDPSNDQVNIANNLVTTVGTLVVALAGFYFGTRAVEVAKGAVDRTLSIISPAEKPYKMDLTQGKTLEITVKPTPEGESVTWETPPEGDKDGSLIQIEPNKFKYTRGSDPQDTVILRFKLSRYPDVKAELEVTKKT